VSDRERARRVRPEDDRGSGPVALAIVSAAAVSFALVVLVLLLCGLVFVYFFSAYVAARLLRLVRLPLRRVVGRRGRGSVSLALGAAWSEVARSWRNWA
jgi:hypothetical protein